MRGISWLAENLLASQEGLSWMELDLFKYLRYFEVFGNESISRGSAVSAVLRLRAGQPWERIPQRKQIFFFSKNSWRDCG